MSKKSIKEDFKTIFGRYHKALRAIKHLILNEFCANTGYDRKYAIRKLNNLPPAKSSGPYRRQRGYVYSSQVLSILAVVWEAAGYPCSIRLKALLGLWMPWIRKKFRISSAVEKQLLSISARQIDRRLKDKKAHIRKRIYGRTRPGTLLKYRIPV
jgi:hypothetical protein